MQSFKICFAKVAKVERDVKVALRFKGRGSRDPKEADELRLASAPKAFRDIRHDRDGSAANLIAESEIRAEFASVRYFINLRRQYACFFPALDIFKVMNGHTTIVSKPLPISPTERTEELKN